MSKSHRSKHQKMSKRLRSKHQNISKNSDVSYSLLLQKRASMSYSVDHVLPTLSPQGKSPHTSSASVKRVILGTRYMAHDGC